MAAAHCAVAEFHSLIKDLPEPVHVLSCAESDINKVYRHNALIEAAIILALAFPVVSCIRKVSFYIGTVRGQEGTAAHACIHIAL